MINPQSATQGVSTSEKAVTNNGPFTVVGMQKASGDRIFWMDCIQVKQLGSDSFQTAYEYCTDRFGRNHRMDLDQIQDPTPLQLSARGNVERMQQLYQLWLLSKERGCGINMYVAQRDCIKPALVNSPNFFKRAFTVYDMKATGRWTFGNDTVAGDNSKTPQIAEDQGQFLPGSMGVSMQYRYSQVNAAIPGTGFDEMVVVDVGGCAQGENCGCPVPGGQMVIGITAGTADVQMSIDGGKNFANVTAGIDPAFAISTKDGIVHYLTRNVTSKAISFFVGVPNATFTGITFSAATTLSGTPIDSHLTGAKGNSPTDDQYGGLLWAGKGGQVFLSENNGSSWGRIATGVSVNAGGATVVDFLSLSRVGRVIYGVGYSVTGTNLLFLQSTNGGFNWTLTGFTSLALMPTLVKQTAIGYTNYVNVNGVVYRFTCDAVSAALTPGGFATVNQLISNPRSANDVLLLPNTGALARTMDQFSSAGSEKDSLGSLYTTLLTTNLISAQARAVTQYSDRILFSHGTGLYAADEIGTPFS